jgi:hypothetical protein
MADKTIEFDVESLIGNLSPVELTQVEYAGAKALQRLGYELKQKATELMAATFRDPVPFTLSSPRYAANGLELRMFIRQERTGSAGQDPARYLYPVSTSGTTGSKPAYPTTFTRGLRHEGIVGESYFPIPWREGRGVPAPNSYGNIPGSFYRETLRGLRRQGAAGEKRTKQSGWQYFSIPDRSVGPNIRGGAALQRQPGIYRVKNRDLQFLFGYARRPPIVPTIFDWNGLITEQSNALLPNLLRLELDRATR